MRNPRGDGLLKLTSSSCPLPDVLAACSGILILNGSKFVPNCDGNDVQLALLLLLARPLQLPVCHSQC